MRFALPAELSSPIPSGLDPLCDAGPLQDAETPHLLVYLAASPTRVPLVAAAAVLASACSMTAIAEWVGAWLCDRDRPRQQRQWRRAIAVDGKTLRGARRDGRQVHLLAAMDHATRAVLAQRQVDGAPGEVPAFQPLLDGLDLAGAVITAAALQTHADTAEFRQERAHYLLVVKVNQLTLVERCAVLARHNVPVADRTRDRGHGRVEIRILKAVSVRHFGFPHAAQVLQVTRKVCDLATRKWARHALATLGISLG